MNKHEIANPQDDEQAKLWNGPGGRAWVATQEVLDQIFRPLEALLVDTVSKRPRGRVLDVGCGTGSTTLAFARVWQRTEPRSASIFPIR